MSSRGGRIQTRRFCTNFQNLTFFLTFPSLMVDEISSISSFSCLGLTLCFSFRSLTCLWILLAGFHWGVFSIFEIFNKRIVCMCVFQSLWKFGKLLKLSNSPHSFHYLPSQCFTILWSVSFIIFQNSISIFQTSRTSDCSV